MLPNGDAKASQFADGPAAPKVGNRQTSTCTRQSSGGPPGRLGRYVQNRLTRSTCQRSGVAGAPPCSSMHYGDLLFLRFHLGRRSDLPQEDVSDVEIPRRLDGGLEPRKGCAADAFGAVQTTRLPGGRGEGFFFQPKLQPGAPRDRNPPQPTLVGNRVDSGLFFMCSMGW